DESGLYQEVHRQLFQQLFPTGHPYARGVGGTEASLPRLTLDQARAFVQAHYRPKEMTWILAGAFDRSQVAELLERSVPAELRAASPPAPDAHHGISTGLPPPAPAKLPVVVAPVQRQQLVVGWVLPPSNGRMEPVHALLPQFVEVRARYMRGVEGASASLLKHADASVLTLSVELEEGRDPEDMLKKLREDWDLFWREGTLTRMDRMERQFVNLRASTVVFLGQQYESILTRTLERAARARVTSSATTLKAQSDAIAALTFKDVLAAGRSAITGDELRAVLLTPRTGDGHEDDTRTQGVPSAFAPDSLRAEYPTSAVAAFVRGPRVTGARSFVASNGLHVELVPDGKSGLVTATLAVPAGRRTSSPSGLADRFRWYRQSHEYGDPSSYGATARNAWTDDSLFLEYRGSGGNLSNLLAMMSERILTLTAEDPYKPPQAPTSERESRAFDRMFWTTVEGDSAVPSRPANEIAAIDARTASRWWEAIMDPRRAMLVIAGDMPASVQEDVERWLSRWRTPRDARDFRLPPPPDAPGALRVVRVSMKQGKQVRVRLACNVQTQTLEQELAARMLAIKLERQWTMLERETLGSSYGFGATTTIHRDGSAQLLISGRVDVGSVRRMTVAVSQGWKALPESGTTENELNRLRWEFGRSYNVKFLTSQALARAVAEQQLRGRNSEALDEVPRALLRVTPAELTEVGKQCQRSAVLGLLGDPAVLEVDALLP
ncbi:MAG TPA: insulinase family protein, partial [Myxococcaceae bacterium]|nr:insulinase family protein [Myxococcaceae bacterium]